MDRSRLNHHDPNAQLVKNPLHWFVRVFPADRERCRLWTNVKQGQAQRGEITPTLVGASARDPWWNDYHGKAAEVAAGRTLGAEPNWKHESDGGIDIIPAPGIYIDVKWTHYDDEYSPKGYGYWLYFGRFNTDYRAANVLLGVTSFDAEHPNGKDYKLHGWIARDRFDAIKRRTPFDHEAYGVRQGHLNSMESLYDAIQKRRRVFAEH